MQARFDSLRRKQRYIFVFGGGINAIDGIFHEYRSDGTLLVAGNVSGSFHGGARTFIINPDQVVYVQEA